MEKNKEYSITTKIMTYDNGKTVIHLQFPDGQEQLDVRHMAHLLMGGVSLLIKSCNNSDLGIKDHELMKEMYEHLTSEFTNDSYSDAEFIKNKKDE